MPRGALKRLCEVSALYRDADNTYPVLIHEIQEAQEKGNDLRKAIASDKKALSLAQKISMESKFPLLNYLEYKQRLPTGRPLTTKEDKKYTC